jgi:hypothetical protein
MSDNGTRTPVNATAENIKFIPGSSTIDGDHGILYVIGTTVFTGPNTTLVGVSLKTGSVVSSVAIPIIGPGYEVFAADLVYASDLGEVILLVTTSTKQQVLGTIHPTTGKWNVITTVSSPEMSKVDQASMVYVPGKQICVFQLGVNRVLTHFAYNFKIGALKNATSAQFSNFVYNPTDGMIWGHGITMNGKYYVRELSKLDPSTLKVETVKVLNSLAVDGGDLATIDVEKQTMYWVSSLYKDEPNPGPPFYLVQVSLANASVVSQSLVCRLWNYPWSPGNCPCTLDSF